jgi:hypothetical protein
MDDLANTGQRQADVVDYLLLYRDARRAGYLLDLDLDAIHAIIRHRDDERARITAAYRAIPSPATGSGP